MHTQHLARFYELLAKLDKKVGRRKLIDCHGRLNWPRRGVYFFFEKGELRSDGFSPRIVRVGTHAVSANSKTTLWSRLLTHRGTSSGGGNHRASIFRAWVGSALLRFDESLNPKPTTWGKGSSANREVRETEKHVESVVSAYICAMPFLWIAADDEPGTDSIRSVIEKGSLALLSCSSKIGITADRPSENWLGLRCPNETLSRSGLWNVRDVDGRYEPDFLDLLASCVAKTETL